jgi:hypothetical protein
MLPPCALVQAGSFEGTVGLDLMQWGDIDDVTANQNTTGAAQWVLTGNATATVEGGNQFLRLQPSRVRGASVRPVARSTTPLHRWYDATLQPVDGEPAYAVRLRTRATGVTKATLRIAVYDVDDTDPTTEPVSTLLHETSVPLPVPDSADWRDLDVDVSSIINDEVGPVRPNAVLVYIDVPSGSPRLDIDEVRLLEWRDMRAVPEGVWMPADAVRSPAPATPTAANAEITLQQSGCGTPTG